MTGNIVWIASYPKSGNTWFRAWMANLVSSSEEPVHINSLPVGIGNSRTLFDTVSGIDSTNLFPEEVDRLRPDFYKELSSLSGANCYYKIHDAYQQLPDGQACFPADATRCTLYIVRNPLDVAPSFAHFLRRDIDQVIAEMNQDEFIFNREREHITPLLSLKLCSWSEHVLSWLEAPAGMNVHLMRYEDMLRHPEATLSQAVRAIGLDKSEEDIRRTITFSSFDTLKAMENQAGFKEKPPQADAFFREGRSGGWRDSLSPQQVSTLIEKHGAVMQRLGYLDANGQVIDL
nr:sulfotransferase domain-containing protein [uncultured Rhodoferax sp.]